MNIYKRRYRNTIILITGILYYIFFMLFSRFDNKVPFAGDMKSYQTMAVNFAKGHGFNIMGGIESFNVYCFKSNCENDDESTIKKNLYGLHSAQVNYYRTPGYPLFMGCMYKLFGISPLTLKYIQLLLLVLAACFIIVTSFHLWGLKGFYLGWISSLLLLISIYKLAGDIMTESLIFFILSISILLMVLFLKFNNFVYAILTGIVFGLVLLIKGSLIFVPILFCIALLIQLVKFKKFNLLVKLIMIIFFTIATILPWTIYINRCAYRDTTELKFYKKQIINGQYKTSNSGTIIKRMIDEITKCYDKTQVIHIIDKRIHDIDFIILSNQGNSLLIESNNEMCIDGGWHPEGAGNVLAFKSFPNSFYYHDGLEFGNSLKRVLNFYWHNLKLISVIFPNKLISGFLNLFFFCLFLILLIFDLIFVSIPLKIRKYRVFTIILLILLITGYTYTYINDSFIVVNFFRRHLLIFYISFLLLAIGIILKHKSLIIIQIPFVFKIVILNFIIIVLIFYGIDRITLPVYIIIIPFSVFYFCKICSRKTVICRK